jgi:hypothetical protein
MRKFVCFVLLVLGLAIVPATAMAAASDVPGTPITVGQTVSGTVDLATKPHDVYGLHLQRGEEVQIALTLPASTRDDWDVDVNHFVYLLSPSSKSVAKDEITTVARGEWAADPSSATWSITYVPAATATYFIDVRAEDHNGLPYQLVVAGSADKPRYPTHTFLHAARLSVLRGGRVKLSGSLVDQNLASLTGESVVLLVSTNGRTWRAARTISAVSSRFACSLTLGRTTYFRVRFAGDKIYASSMSKLLVVKVRR